MAKKDFWKDWNPMTDEEVRDHALGLRTGEWSLIRPENMSLQAGLFVGLMGFDKYTKKSLEKLGAVLGDNSKVFPRAINGLPMFSSIKVIHVEDWKRIVSLVQKLKEAENAVLQSI